MGHTVCGPYSPYCLSSEVIKYRVKRDLDFGGKDSLFTDGPCNKWSKYFDMRLHRRRRRTVQTYSPDGANVPCHVVNCLVRGADNLHVVQLMPLTPYHLLLHCVAPFTFTV